MSKLCINCQSENIDEVAKKDRRFFYCHHCGKTSSRFLDKESNIVSGIFKGNPSHFTVGALIESEKTPGRYLFLKKRSFPYDLDIPAGHLEYNETTTQAVIRETMEETGLTIENPRLVFHATMENDPCRYGSKVHTWYVFQAFSRKEKTFVNSEANDCVWLTLEQALSEKLVESAREIITKYIDQEHKSITDDHLLVSKDTSLSIPEKQDELLYHLSQVFFRTSDIETILEIAASEIRTAMNVISVSIILSGGKSACSSIKTHKDKNNLSVELPIKSNGETMGIIRAISNTQTKNFLEHEIEFLNIIAGQLSIAIENNRLIASIQEERSLLNKIIDNSKEGIAVIGSDGIVSIWNSYFEVIFGLSREEVVGKHGYNDIIKILKLQDIFQPNMIKAEAAPFYFEKEFACANGEKMWLGTNVSLLQNNGSKSMVIVSRNISREKELLRAKNELISTATHELRTPLTAVKGYLSMVRNGDAGEVSAKVGKYLDKAYQSSERLVSLVEDFLNTLRIDENKLTLNILDFDLCSVVKEAIESLKPKAENCKTGIIFSHASKKVFVHGDPIKTKHAIENLIDNAIKYTKQGGEIRIRIKPAEQSVIITIEDSGIGIPSRYLATIFDRFTRVPNDLSVKAGGTGLGLYIVKNIVEKQGGRIWVESKVNKGSVFQFTIPKAININ